MSRLYLLWTFGIVEEHTPFSILHFCEYCSAVLVAPYCTYSIVVVMSTYNHEKPWLARVLIPFWCIQLLITAILFVLSVWAVTMLEKFDTETGLHFFSYVSSTMSHSHLNVLDVLISDVVPAQ